MRKILIGVDDTDDAQKAVKWVTENFLRDGDEVHFLHVVPRIHAPVMYGAPAVDFAIQEETSNEEKIIAHAEAFIRQRCLPLLPTNIPAPIIHIVKSETDTDSIGHILCKRAVELDVNAVALAPHSKTKLQAFFLGSVANYVAHHCSKPLLLAH